MTSVLLPHSKTTVILDNVIKPFPPRRRFVYTGVKLDRSFVKRITGKALGKMFRKFRKGPRTQ